MTFHDLLERIGELEARIEVMESKPMLTRKDLARHYARGLRTIDRFHAEGILPTPVYIHGPLWRPVEIYALTLPGKTRKP